MKIDYCKKMATKEKLDDNKAPGQCYDGFLYQLVDLWKRTEERHFDYTMNLNKGR